MKNYIRRPQTSKLVSLTPREVASAYNFPFRAASGKGFTAGIIELGGGFKQAQVAEYFTSNNIQTPIFESVAVAGGKNKPDGPDGADGEVQLDMCVFGSIAPSATQRIYFTKNSDTGFLAALKQAVSECDGVSISWGSSENNWDAATMDAFEQVIKSAADYGVPVFVAAGDSGSQDSSGDGNQVDFPASSPSAIGCGGTRLVVDAAASRVGETVWDDNDTQSATGGGVSQHFSDRQVPDIAGNADPDTGYEIMVDGQRTVVGGTSAVAPLMLGLHALLWESNGGNPFDMRALINSNPECFFDVTQGDNGGYRAGPGRDDVTGLGVPDGMKLLAALHASPPPNPPATPGLTVFPVNQVAPWVHATNYTKAETAAKKAIVAWAAANGIAL